MASGDFLPAFAFVICAAFALFVDAFAITLGFAIAVTLSEDCRADKHRATPWGMSPSFRRLSRVWPVALVAAVAVAGGCGPSSAETRRARSVVYQTEFARVWNAVSATVKAEYPRLVIEDPVRGRLLTDWHLVERVDAEDAVETQGTGVVGPSGPANTTGQPQMGGKFFRIAVVIKPGGPPWKLQVDGEAALYRPGMAMITPFDHDDADEPTWVRPRIDKIKVGIYKRLEGFARQVEEAPAKGPAALDAGPWKNLPAGAPEVAAGVHAAARQKNTSVLRRFMSDEFTWSAGGTPSADTALSMWSADPLVLAALVKTLEAGCSERETDTLIVCPARGGGLGQWRAELRKQGKTWRFAAFFREE